MNRLVLVALVVCACRGTSSQSRGTGSGTGNGTATTGTATSCDALRPKIEALYRADAEAKEPKRVDEAVADNTRMVMNDCAKSPDKVVACANAVASVAELEARCLTPLDDEGTEGHALRKPAEREVSP